MPKKTKTATAADSTPSFEASISQLAEIVEKLEGGELPLEDALRLFEQGMGLARSSQDVLDRAEKRVEQLLGFDADGKPLTAEVEDEIE